MPHFVQVDFADAAAFNELRQLIAFGIAHEQRRPIARSVAVSIGLGEQAETIGIAALVRELLGPYNGQIESPDDYMIPHPESLDASVSHKVARCLAEARARIAWAGQGVVGQQHAPYFHHAVQGGERSHMIVVSVRDDDCIEAENAMTRQRFA